MTSGTNNTERNNDYPHRRQPHAQKHLGSDGSTQSFSTSPDSGTEGMKPGHLWPICAGPGRNGEPKCGNPAVKRSANLCASHDRQVRLTGELVPLRTRKSKAPCVGPGHNDEACGRRVYFREPGQDDGVCKSHYDQLKRRGWLSAVAPKPAPVPDSFCKGPGQDGSPICDRKAEYGSGYCGPHDRQYRKTGNLKAIRRINTPDGPCIAPGDGGSACGRSVKNKSLKFCGGHYAQQRRGDLLTPLKTSRKRGVSTPCKFPGCRYLDAPDGNGYCRHHWRQQYLGQDLVPLKGTTNRGRQVLLRDASGNKLCPSCGVWKPEADFSRNSKSSDKLNHRCRRCHASAQKKAKYGISLVEFESFLQAQGGSCAICPATAGPDGRRLSIDHDHACCPGTLSCGKCIRGLLCPDCNRGLGLFRDSISSLLRAAEYVRRGEAIEPGIRRVEVNNDQADCDGGNDAPFVGEPRSGGIDDDDDDEGLIVVA